MQATAATPRLKTLLMFALLFVVICDQMPLRHPQESLWLRQSLKMRTTLETLSSKSNRSTLNPCLQTRATTRCIRSLVARPNFHQQRAWALLGAKLERLGT
jgi:hypothetical protein